MTVKNCFLLLIATCFVHTLAAQTDTVYYDALHEEVSNRALSSYYTVITKRNNMELYTEYYISGIKRSYYMKKKLPEIDKDELVVVGFDPNKGKSKSPKTAEKAAPKDSVMIKHGNFMDWYETGELKAQGAYFAGQLHDELKTFYKNQKLKRHDVYHLDSLKSGHCYDSLGTEIAYIPYYIQPEFKGGQAALFRFLAQNVKYPASARESGHQGAVYINFTVDKQGKIKNVNADNKLNKKMDVVLIEESIRVVRGLPAWTAGTMDGEKVNVRYTLPIKFAME
jgi:hypothetical protein